MFTFLNKHVGKGQSGGRALAKKILAHVPSIYRPIVRLVNKEANVIMDEVEKELPHEGIEDGAYLHHWACSDYAKVGNLSCLVFAYANGAPLENVCLAACENGHLDILKWAMYKEDTGYEEVWALAAVKHNHMHIFTFLFESGMLFDIAKNVKFKCADLVYFAASPTEVLDFLVSHVKLTPLQLSDILPPFRITGMSKQNAQQMMRWFARQLRICKEWQPRQSMGWAYFYDEYVTGGNYSDYRWFMNVTAGGARRAWNAELCDQFVHLGRTDILLDCVMSSQCRCGIAERHK